ncbi:hypothetical protein [Sphingomonas baiyangensis]|uniref:DUF3325 domain-containing protein n=1 Tax=Sphingomonas baiyangensis TaxID=2572576 RepID=A0A4U1L1I7_9SPHN|nr:hypothetical protein [Sphingomonas baiyangensis]TKD49876.1 hypothetical protein FBR43_03150 [Sphingomonas baiyangensis]
MGSGALPLWIAGLLGAGGVGVLRHAWSLPQRSPGWNAAGWLAIAAAVVVAWGHSGAWGVSVAALVTTTAAFVALGVAGATAPRGRAASSNRRAGMLPQPGEPRHLARRLGTFAIVMPLGFAVALLLGLATRGLGMALGWGEANANVAALFVVPLGWAVLATVLLMQTRRMQLLTMAGCAILCAPLMLTGWGS